jgi:hypothetical protein
MRTTGIVRAALAGDKKTRQPQAVNCLSGSIVIAERTFPVKRLVQTAEAAVLFCIEPVTAARLRVFWLKEPTSPQQALNGALIVVATATITSVPGGRRPLCCPLHAPFDDEGDHEPFRFRVRGIRWFVDRQRSHGTSTLRRRQESYEERVAIVVVRNEPPARSAK